MKLEIGGKYLVIPINTGVRDKKIRLSDPADGSAVLEFTAPLDTIRPRFQSYINVEKYLGRIFDVVIEPEAVFSCAFSDSLPKKDPPNCLRPFVHYTTRTGWLSDPNGLFFWNGTYHLFYQYNPGSTMWGNMHWGHAVSPDLLHWTELDPALVPDGDGAIFSGSAFVDSENASGLREDPAAPPPVLLFYTAAGGISEMSKGKSFTQCMAYSLDGGRTFEKYANNPILPCILRDNRDPKVVYAPEIGQYVMALYMEENRYGLFVSPDLLDWRELQQIYLPEDRNCPDLYPLPVGSKERLWVFSGGQDTYMVGHITREGFIPVQKARLFHFGGECSCAAQTFSFPNSLECGSLYPRRIRMVYERMHMADAPFENQMGIPTEMSLVKVDGIYRLRSVPVPEIASLYLEEHAASRIRVAPDSPYRLALPAQAADITIRSRMDTGRYRITVFGVSMEVVPAKNKLIIESTPLGVDGVPLSYRGEGVELRLLIDTAGLELFLDGGLIYSTASIQADLGMAYLLVRSAEEAILEEIRAHALRSIWDGEKNSET